MKFEKPWILVPMPLKFWWKKTPSVVTLGLGWPHENLNGRNQMTNCMGEKIRFRRFRIRENMWWTRYRSLKEGEPQLTMTSIFSLEDLAPFFAAICESVTKQQTKGQSRRKPLRSFTRSVNLKMFFWCIQFKKKSALASKKRSNQIRSQNKIIQLVV